MLDFLQNKHVNRDQIANQLFQFFCHWVAILKIPPYTQEKADEYHIRLIKIRDFIRVNWQGLELVHRRPGTQALSGNLAKGSGDGKLLKINWKKTEQFRSPSNPWEDFLIIAGDPYLRLDLVCFSNTSWHLHAWWISWGHSKYPSVGAIAATKHVVIWKEKNTTLTCSLTHSSLASELSCFPQIPQAFREDINEYTVITNK